jgi:thiamine biosynthesis lipoprotein
MPETTIRRCKPLLGTFVEITAPAGHDNAVEAAFCAMAQVHARMSFHDEASDLAALRRASPGRLLKVDTGTVAVLRIAAGLHDRSGGLFDVAVGAGLAAAGFLPIPPGIVLNAMTGTAADIEILDDTHVACHRPILIDLGGIAKGYAVDRAVEVLMAAGVDHAIVNAGGDLRVLGHQPEWIQLREADGSLGDGIEIANAALASSANVLGRRTREGAVATPHIGRNGSSVMATHAVTVVATRCVIADAMTKIALADPGLAAEMLVELDGEIVVRPQRRAA